MTAKKERDARDTALRETLAYELVDTVVDAMTKEGKKAVAEERPASKQNASRIAKQKVLDILEEYSIKEKESKNG